jgi:hypothetical protein
MEQSAAARMFFSQFLRDLAGAYPSARSSGSPSSIVVGSFKDASGLDHDVIELKTATDLVPDAAGGSPFANVGDYYYVRYYVADGVLYREVNPTGDPDGWHEPFKCDYAVGSEFIGGARQLVVNKMDYRYPEGWVRLPGDANEPRGYEIVLHMWDRTGLSGTSGFREFRCVVPVPEGLR